ncbi:MAG: hypothetical protein K0U93_05760, partial [Gammaproteobacteria bacterium]|nr:hypothetical protein [Gammaproteobacteria bacterium]
DDRENALKYLRLAGDKSARLFALIAARTHYRDALAVNDKRGALDPQRATATIDLTLRLAAVSNYEPTADLPEMLRNAVSAARQLEDEAKIASTSYWLGRTQFLLGDLPDAAENFEYCVRIAERTNDDNLLAMASTTIGRVCVFTAEYDKGIDYLTRGIAMHRERGNLVEVAYSTSFLGILWGVVGDFDKALTFAHDSIEFAREAQNISHEAMALKQLGGIQTRMGEIADGLANSRRAIELAEEVGDSYTVGNARLVEGWALHLDGDSDGIEIMREGVARIEGTAARLSLTVSYGVLAECCATGGMLEQASAYAEQSLSAMGRYGDRFGDSYALRAKAIVAAHQRDADFESACAYLHRAIELSQDRGELSFVALSELRLAEVLTLARRSAEAKTAAGRAHDLFESMGLPFWSHQSAKLLAE